MSGANSLRFRLPDPYLLRHCVVAEEIDEYRHVNNSVYLRWLDTVAWRHSAALGLSRERCLELRRGMAVRHTRIDYLQAAVEGDALCIGTWIVASDGRLRCRRRFEVLREPDALRILEAEIDYVCLNLDTGRPSRFPPEFTLCYSVPNGLAAALAALPAGDPIGFERG